jgi:long-chain fatty acid transport protein
MNLKLKFSAAVVFSLISSGSAYAAGYAIQEQSVTGLGRAFAGSAAAADDASTIFFNPAGLTYLKRAEMDIAANYISPRSEFNNDGSSIAGVIPLTGGDYGDASENAIVPNFYYAHPINDRVSVGLGVTAPFGLVTEYNETWVGRYFAVKSDMLTVNFNPSIAFKATDKLSLGFGVSAQYIDVELSQMADLGAKLGPGPQQADGKVDLQADDWGYGYNLGLLYQVTPDTRLGLSYRSKISHTLKGDGELTNSSGAVVYDENIKADLDLPESVSLALQHQINSQWAVMADVTMTRWSRFSELSIESSQGNLSSDKSEDWENSMRYGLGLEYKYNDNWQFRTGVAYDETPIPDKTHRTARIPGTDRTWLAFGASYHYSDNIVIDASYAHLFMNDPDIDETDENNYNLKGSYEASVDLIGVQLRWLM